MAIADKSVLAAFEASRVNITDYFNDMVKQNSQALSFGEALTKERIGSGKQFATQMSISEFEERASTEDPYDLLGHMVHQMSKTMAYSINGACINCVHADKNLGAFRDYRAMYDERTTLVRATYRCKKPPEQICPDMVTTISNHSLDAMSYATAIAPPNPLKTITKVLSPIPPVQEGEIEVEINMLNNKYGLF